jgi:hypothetical protein
VKLPGRPLTHEERLQCWFIVAFNLTIWLLGNLWQMMQANDAAELLSGYLLLAMWTVISACSVAAFIIALRRRKQ